MQEKSRRRTTLKRKFIVMFFIFTIIMLAVAAGISYSFFKDSMDDYYKTSAFQLAATQASFIEKNDVLAVTEKVMQIFNEYTDKNGIPEFDEDDTESIEAYYALFDEVYSMSEYERIMEKLRSIYDDNTVQSCYLFVCDLERNVGLYIVDCDREEDACPIGAYDILVEEEAEYMRKSGDYNLDAYITRTDYYGWLVTSAAAITGSEDEYVIQSYVDISMDKIVHERYSFLNKLILTLLIVSAIIITLLLLFITKLMINPIRRLDKAAAHFVSDREAHGKEEASELSKLEVKTRDEVEALTNSVQKMECEINDYIDNLTEITATRERISTELNVATKIQADMLPTKFPDNELYSLSAFMTPAKEVGGDFYDFFLVDETHLAIVMADVSGKGVPAALFMVIGKTLINNQSSLEKDLGSLFTKVNNMLCDVNREGLFITAFEAVIDLETGDVVFVNAGHEQPFIYHAADNKFTPMKMRPGFVLAGMEGVNYRAGSFKIEPGDKIFQYTDGVTEATDSENKLYGMDRLEKCLTGVGDKSPAEIIMAVKNDIDLFVGDAEQFDDITMLCVNFKSYASAKTEKFINISADIDNLPVIIEFVDRLLDKNGCMVNIKSEINVAVDEIASNIVHYAYKGRAGDLTLMVDFEDCGRKAIITFKDSGMRFNPLEKDDPDVNKNAEERKIGGLGIYIVKKLMDFVSYEYSNGMNVLRLEKKIRD